MIEGRGAHACLSLVPVSLVFFVLGNKFFPIRVALASYLQDEKRARLSLTVAASA